MSKSHRNQNAQGEFEKQSLMSLVADIADDTTVNVTNLPFPGPGDYLVTPLELVPDRSNKCVRMRCNIDKVFQGPTTVQGRNFITTFWFNNPASTQWSARTIMRAVTGERFFTGEVRLYDVMILLNGFLNTQFYLERRYKPGRDGRTFANDLYLPADQVTASNAEPEPAVDDIAKKLAK